MVSCGLALLLQAFQIHHELANIPMGLSCFVMDLRRFRIDLCGILWTSQSFWTDRVSYGLIQILEELTRSFNHLSILSWTCEIPHRLANTLMGSPHCVMDLPCFRS